MNHIIIYLCSFGFVVGHIIPLLCVQFHFDWLHEFFKFDWLFVIFPPWCLFIGSLCFPP